MSGKEKIQESLLLDEEVVKTQQVATKPSIKQ